MSELENFEEAFRSYIKRREAGMSLLASLNAALSSPGPSCEEQAEIDSFRTQPAHVTFTEPERSPLDWNKPTPFNNFEGYEVHKWISFDELCQGPRDVPQNAVQRMGDLGNPLHGSASLLKA